MAGGGGHLWVDPTPGSPHRTGARSTNCIVAVDLALRHFALLKSGWDSPQQQASAPASAPLRILSWARLHTAEGHFADQLFTMQTKNQAAFVRAAAAGGISAVWAIYVGEDLFPFPLFFGIVVVIVSFLNNGESEKRRFSLASGICHHHLAIKC